MTQSEMKCHVGDKKVAAASDFSFWRSKLVCDKKRHAIIHYPLFPFLSFPGNHCLFAFKKSVYSFQRSLPVLLPII
jgi:hypothetical protein